MHAWHLIHIFFACFGNDFWENILIDKNSNSKNFNYFLQYHILNKIKPAGKDSLEKTLVFIKMFGTFRKIYEIIKKQV